MLKARAVSRATSIVASQCLSSRDAPLVMRYLRPLISACSIIFSISLQTFNWSNLTLIIMLVHVLVSITFQPPLTNCPASVQAVLFFCIPVQWGYVASVSRGLWLWMTNLHSVSGQMLVYHWLVSAFLLRSVDVELHFKQEILSLWQCYQSHTSWPQRWNSHPGKLTQQLLYLPIQNVPVLWFNFVSKFMPKGPIDSQSALVQVMACHLTGGKALPEPMLTKVFDTIMIWCR